MGQRTCALCHKRPRWRDGACKRCWHRHLWPERPSARHRAALPAEDTGPLVYDGYLDSFRPADPVSLDPLDQEAIAAWGDDHGRPWDPDGDVPAAAPASREPRTPAREHPRCRLCRKVRHRYVESLDGLLRLCLDCAQGAPLPALTAGEAAAALIALRRPANRAALAQRLRARLPELPWDTDVARARRQPRHRKPVAPGHASVALGSPAADQGP